MTPERFAKLVAVLRQRQPDLTVLMDDVHKPHNISAVLRTCDAVGIHRLHAVSSSEVYRHHMMTGGSRRFVEIDTHASIGDAIAELRRQGFTLLAAHSGPAALDYRSVDYTRPVAIALGGELRGPGAAVLDEADGFVAIPIHGLVESLNVSVAAAVILYEAQRQRGNAGLYEECRLEADEYARTLFEWSHPEIAERCRRRGVPYPALSADGDLIENPLRDAGS